MSTAVFQVKASGMAIKNDALREAFAVDSTRCFLLRRAEHSSTFTNLGELTSGHRLKFDDNRSESGLFRHASTDLSFRDTWAQVTHIAYGVGSSLEVFAFIVEEKDSIDPDASSVYWSGRVVKIANERYTVV
jgi:hypothetical protein